MIGVDFSQEIDTMNLLEVACSSEDLLPEIGTNYNEPMIDC